MLAQIGRAQTAGWGGAGGARGDSVRQKSPGSTHNAPGECDGLSAAHPPLLRKAQVHQGGLLAQ